MFWGYKSVLAPQMNSLDTPSWHLGTVPQPTSPRSKAVGPFLQQGDFPTMIFKVFKGCQGCCVLCPSLRESHYP